MGMDSRNQVWKRVPEDSIFWSDIIWDYWLRKKRSGGRNSPYRYERPQRVWVLFFGCFGLKYGIDFNYFDLKVCKRVWIGEARAEKRYQNITYLGLEWDKVWRTELHTPPNIPCSTPSGEDIYNRPKRFQPTGVQSVCYSPLVVWVRW